MGEYLRTNQQKAGVDVSVSETPTTESDQNRSLEMTFTHVEKRQSQDPSQGRRTPTWFQAPNQSDTETAVNSQGNGNSSEDSDTENRQFVEKRSTKVFNKNLTKKVLK